MEEVWKDIPGFEGYYQASNFGRVRGLDRTVPTKNGFSKKIKGRIMSQSVAGTGYMQVMITKNGKQQPHTVHRLVASAFIENPNGYNEVDHIDGTRTNNNVNNLRWVTHYEYVMHMHELGRWYDGSANITNQEAREKALSRTRRPVMRSDGKIYRSVSEAAKTENVARSSISRACKSDSYTCHGFKYKYVEI